MNPWALVVAGTAVAFYGVLSRRLSTTVVSGPLVFVAAGLAIGPLGLGLVQEDESLEPVRALLEGALAVVLFTDASAIRGASCGGSGLCRCGCWLWGCR